MRNAGSHIGQAMLMDEVVGVDFGENWVSVDPAVDYDETVDAIQEIVDGYPGIYRDVQTYLKERIREVLTGSSEPITIRVFGIRPRVAAGAGGRGQRDPRRPFRASSRTTSSSSSTSRRSGSRWTSTPPRSYGVKPGDVRRAAAG